jgi:flagellar assembly factor FliW
VQIYTTRFGLVETDDREQIHFPTGLLGFPDLKDYVVLEMEQETPCKWLQAMTDPDIAFVVVDPYLIMSDYQITVSRDDLRDLQAEAAEQLLLLAILTIPPRTQEPSRITVNLQGPLVVNTVNHWAKQLVLMRSPYHTRHPLGPDSRPETNTASKPGKPVLNAAPRSGRLVEK